MAKLESSFKNMFIVLTVISLIAAGALAGMYSLTKDTIAQSKAKKTEEAIKSVLPEGAVPDAVPDTLGSCLIYKAHDAEGNFVGAAIQAEDGQAFGGNIQIMVGFDIEGNIIDYSVLAQAETPGLGTKMVDWFKRGNKGDITGKNPANDNLTVSKDGGDVEAITASTISSRAFLRAVNAAYQAYAGQNVDAASGATQAVSDEEVDAQIQAEVTAQLSNDSTSVETK